MSDVFISYSRKDKAFVQRLDEALRKREREAWVDWEGIRPTEEFMQAIYGAIEGADTFLFILSPDSVSSVVCGKEIAHAVAQNKRMVPIVAREVNAAEVPEALAKLNWIFCRESDAFDAATDTLISALDTDLDWVRAHTRLLTRSVEWETKGNNSSFVLRGDDLRAAEQWLTEAGTDKERQPTPLQTAYIITSRKAAARRQRITLGAVTFGAVVAIVLAIVALFQRGEARKQTGIAKANEAEAIQQKEAAIEALSRSYFTEGNRLAGQGQAARALAYCAAAVRKNGHLSAATRIATLLTDRVWARPLHIQREANATRVWFAPDGRFAVARRADGDAEIRDTAAAKILSPPIRLPGGIGRAWFAPNGARVVISSEPVGPREEAKTSFQLWECQSGSATGGVMIAAGKIGQVFFSPDSRRADVSTDNSTYVFDTQNGTPQWRAEKHHYAGFSADGNRLLTRVYDDTAGTWSAQVLHAKTGAAIGGRIEGDSPVLSPDGTRVATTRTSDWETGEVRVWQVSSGKALTGWLEQEYDVNDLAFSQDGQWLLVVTRAIAQVFDVPTGKALQPPFRLPTGEEMVAACFSPDGERVATGGAEGSVCVWDVRTGRMAAELWAGPRSLETVAFTPDGRAVVTTSSTHLERQVHRVLSGVARPWPLDGMVIAEQGPLLLLIGETKSNGGKKPVRVWNMESGKTALETTVDAGEEEIAAAQFQRDGARVA
ncbi:MAG: toll/interleukin-1 receptor domain-containing protein, partial [Chthoniobacteraceae bacterium]